MTMLQFVIYGIIGIILMGVVATKPKYFWPILVIVAVGTAGMMVGDRYTFLDEYLIGCILFGGLLTISMGVLTFQKSRENTWDHLHKWIFLLMIIYMIVQSLRGLIVLESLRKIRWIVYYGMLGIIMFMISNKGFPVPSNKKISLIVSSATLGYLIFYIAYGLFSEIVNGISRWELQCVEWGTTAYSLFPLVIAIPAAIFLLKDRNRVYQRVGLATLIIAALAAFYYNSRVSWLVIFGFLFVCLFKLGIRKVILIIFSFLIIFSLYFGISNRVELVKETSSFFGELSRTTRSIYFWDVSAKTDIDRKTHLKVGLISITENWKTLLFGYGFRVNGLIIGSHLIRLYTQYNLPQLAAKVKDDEGTEGFTALLVDTGVVGIMLLVINFLFVTHKIFVQKRNPNRNLLLLSLIFAFLWLTVINMVDIMLFYFLIMPNGLVVQLSQGGEEE